MIYLHIPFCRSFCIYCGFYSELAGKLQCGKLEADRFERYADQVIREIQLRRQEILASSAVNTFYIGGGTPSILPERTLSRLIEAVKAVYPENHIFDEFTVEVNPEDIVERGEEYVRFLMSQGVNRISMGIQSFDDRILKWMNRRHDAARAETAYHILRNAGMRNISIDLIFGIPSLEMDTWQQSLEKAIALHPEHISAYQLSIDENSALGTMAQEGRFQEAPDELCRQEYDLLCHLLAGAGYHHYEISNFALPGYEAQHNSAYWTRVPYVGLGAGAHSLLADGRRAANGEGLDYPVETEELTEEDVKVETIMLGLRTDIGVKKSYIYNHVDRKIVEEYLASGLLEEHESWFRIPEKNFFISDQIICGLI